MTDAADVVDFDVNTLTLGDLCDIEDAIGDVAASALLRGQMTPKAITAVVWIVKRRDNPEYTFEEARSVPVSALAGDDE